MYDTIIVGGGPAGLSAAVYAKRAGLNALLIEGTPIYGGQVLSTYEVDNYLGLPGISGMELGEKFSEHADKAGIEKKATMVRNLSEIDGGWKVSTDKGTVRKCSFHRSRAGFRRRHSSSAETGSEPGRVEQAPRSMISAPCSRAVPTRATNAAASNAPSALMRRLPG